MISFRWTSCGHAGSVSGTVCGRRLPGALLLRWWAIGVMGMVVAVSGGAACEMDPETRADVALAYVKRWLSLSAPQEAAAVKIKSLYLARRPIIVAKREAAMDVVSAEVVKPVMDLAALQRVRTEWFAVLRAETPAFIDALAEFHGTLLPFQKKEIVTALLQQAKRTPPDKKTEFEEWVDALIDDLNFQAPLLQEVRALRDEAWTAMAPSRAEREQAFRQLLRQLQSAKLSRDWALGWLDERLKIVEAKAPFYTERSAAIHPRLSEEQKHTIVKALGEAKDKLRRRF